MTVQDILFILNKTTLGIIFIYNITVRPKTRDNLTRYQYSLNIVFLLITHFPLDRYTLNMNAVFSLCLSVQMFLTTPLDFH